MDEIIFFVSIKVYWYILEKKDFPTHFLEHERKALLVVRTIQTGNEAYHVDTY